jgi:hypothetical protein
MYRTCILLLINQKSTICQKILIKNSRLSSNLFANHLTQKHPKLEILIL